MDSSDGWDENDDAGHVSGASIACAVDSRVFTGIGRRGGSASGMAVILQWACPSRVAVAAESRGYRHFFPKCANGARTTARGAEAATNEAEGEHVTTH